jgi:gas vesicle protein
MGYFRGFAHGAAVGTVIGLCVAPQTGDKTRAQLQQAAGAIRDGIDATSKALSKMGPVAEQAVQMVERVRHRGDHSDLETNGTGTVRITSELST